MDSIDDTYPHFSLFHTPYPLVFISCLHPPTASRSLIEYHSNSLLSFPRLFTSSVLSYSLCYTHWISCDFSPFLLRLRPTSLPTNFFMQTEVDLKWLNYCPTLFASGFHSCLLIRNQFFFHLFSTLLLHFYLYDLSLHPTLLIIKLVISMIVHSCPLPGLPPDHD